MACRKCGGQYGGCFECSSNNHEPNLIDSSRLVPIMTDLKSKFECNKLLSAESLDLMIDLIFSVNQNQSSSGLLGNIEGGDAFSIYLENQNINGGNA